MQATDNFFSIYRSSAGSGKTRTLAKEYLKLALSHRAFYFRHILAVTFTNKSTQEMKNRILSYLNQFVAGNDPDNLAKELKAELSLDSAVFQERCAELQQSILHQYSQFAISTIDAFFQKVIRAFTRESGLMGDYRLEVEQDAVMEEVIDELMDELGSNSDLTNWVVEFAVENLENEKAWDVRQSLRDFAQEIFREDFKEIEESIINETNDIHFFKNLKSILWQTKNAFLKRVSTPAQEALNLLEEHQIDDADISYGKNSGIITFFQMFATQRKLAEYKEIGKRVRDYYTVAGNWPNKKSPKQATVVQLANHKLVPVVHELLREYDEGYQQALSAELVLKHMHVFGLLADITRKLRDYKYQNNLMLLAEAPQFLNKVIQDSDTPFIYEKVGSFYRNYLIDEFQDTSGYQWKNFLPLLTNSLDSGGKSVLVGDVKQAIYRWRGGDLALLQQKVEEQIGSHRIQHFPLDKNYRSAPKVVEFNNLFFKEASVVVSNAIEHTLPTQVFSDIEQQIHKVGEGFVRVDVIDEELSGEKWRVRALQALPKQLETLQQAGVKIQDIAILVRRNEEGQRIAAHLLQYRTSADALDGCKYDVISSESLRIDGAASVNVLLGAMRYLLNPDDAIARAQLSYEFARLKNPALELSDVFAVSNQPVFESNLPIAFSKSKAFLKKLPLFELTETLIEIFKLGDVQGELAYLQAFQDLVLDFFSRERNDLGAYLEWWEEFGRKKSIQVSGEVEAAQIVTIHKAKGLQFKYVLIPFCTWNMDYDGLNAPLLWVKSESKAFKNAGFMPVQYSSKLKQTDFAAAYGEENVRSHLDNLNLLYVAFTRAEEGLWITIPKEEKGFTVARLIQKTVQSSNHLHAFWNEKELTWKWGAIKPSAQTKKESTEALHLEEYPSFRWRDKLIIKRSAVVPEKLADEVQQKILYGLQMHAVLSRIQYEDQLSVVIEECIADGLLTSADRDWIVEQIQQLLANLQIADWFSRSWEVRTEVPILLPGMEENRIDRLMTSGKRAVVVDFKTGEHSKKDLVQVQDYIRILRQMNFTEVEGYLLYLRTGEVVDVNKEAGQKVKRKKDESQLGLNF